MKVDASTRHDAARTLDQRLSSLNWIHDSIGMANEGQKLRAVRIRIMRALRPAGIAAGISSRLTRLNGMAKSLLYPLKGIVTRRLLSALETELVARAGWRFLPLLHGPSTRTQLHQWYCNGPVVKSCECVRGLRPPAHQETGTHSTQCFRDASEPVACASGSI